MDSSPRGPKARIVASVVLVLFLLAAGFAGFRLFASMKKKPEQGATARPRTVVRTEVAARTDFRERIRAFGRARPLRAAEVSAEVTGTVLWISPMLEAGETVDAGVELVRIDRRDFEQAEAAAEARRKQAVAAVSRLEGDATSLGRRLAIARADLDVARRELTRVGGLVTGGVLTKSDLDRQQLSASLKEQEVLTLESQEASTRQELVRAAAEVQAAAAALARASLDLSRTVVASPWAGRIEARRVNAGVRVAPGTVLFAMVDLARVEVPLAIPASQHGEVRPGSVVELDSGGGRLRGLTVVRVSPVVDPADRTFWAYVVVTGNPGANPLAPGAFVTADVEGTLHAGVIAVPRIALVSGKLYLAEPDGTGEAVVRERQPGVRRLLPEVALIDEGLAEGERIIVTNLEQIADGSRVLLAPDGASGEAAGR
ncbi:MAG: efflux RND transporter periplasmic adaptor subunit [Planctomycetes bacterium]|jgi:RND family efflux transporter MFP subunit|nr:efflux RND transporter periplasmic adaptor subunit [Planctomycetota bacterium]